MTYSDSANATVVGPCIARCESFQDIDYPDITQLNEEQCGFLNRDGQHCSKCTEGYGPPAYSYTLPCVKCDESDLISNIIKYVAVAYLPLTAFFLIAILFKISATSDSMAVVVLTNQIITAPITVQLFTISTHYHTSPIRRIWLSTIGIWNLDFFRSAYTPFCIHPRVNFLHVIALDYLVGLYPLFLIFLTYIAVTLHDRYPIVVMMWRPAYRVFMCIRREWNIRGSLIQAFVTFFVLSYVKILNVSLDILTPVYLQTSEGRSLPPYLYSKGDMLFFGSEHLPYGILAIVMLTIFNILPLLVLFFYPCRCFRRCLSICRVNNHFLFTYMDAFQGSYRHSPMDCRFYLFLRILAVSTFAIVRNQVYYSFLGLYFVAVIIIITLFQPYKRKIYNKIDSVIFALQSMQYAILINTAAYEPRFKTRHIFNPIKLLKAFTPKKISRAISKCCSYLWKKRKKTTDVQSALHAYPNEHTPLLQSYERIK